MKAIKTFTGPFDKSSWRKIRNQVVGMFNTSTEVDKECYTFLVRATTNKGKIKDSWVYMPKVNVELVDKVEIYKIKQEITVL